MPGTPTIVVNPADTTRRHDSRKEHLVISADGRTIYEASDKAEALTWLDGYLAGAASLPDAEAQECEGHPAGPFDPMGETTYCNGSCRS